MEYAVKTFLSRRGPILSLNDWSRPWEEDGMPAADEWRIMIEEGISRRPEPVKAHTYRRCFSSFSSPSLLVCSDGRQYVVKGSQVGRAIVNDQVMGRLGIAMGAPVAEVGLVDVPQELIDLQPEMKRTGIAAGVNHGSIYHPDVSPNREDIAHFTASENRMRFAKLAMMYGWAGVFTDHQFFYENAPPRRVLSFDHGHFFPGGPNWTTHSLQGAAPAVVDRKIVTVCGLSNEEIAEAKPALAAVDNLAIAHAVAVPYDHWKIVMDERIVLAELLAKRRDELLAS